MTLAFVRVVPGLDIGWHNSSQLAVAIRRPIAVDRIGRNSYNVGMKTIVSEKGQITIPKPLRVRLGIRKGEVLEVKEDRGRLVMSKRLASDPFEKYFGILKLGRRTDEIIDELRGSEKPK